VVREISEELGLDTPIADQVYRVVHEGLTAARAYRGLLPRTHRYENEEFG
jgi:glycerol-3-phosphate dehydrogenase